MTDHHQQTFDRAVAPLNARVRERADAQPQGEPVSPCDIPGACRAMNRKCDVCDPDWKPKREPLTDAEIVDIRDDHLPSQGQPFDCIAFARAIERRITGDTE